ncbi:MAG: acylphosphatase [Gaiellaceae bacterium]
MGAERVRVRVRVRGRVQGVGFRQSVASRARSLGLGGSVANLADGSVEAVFEGQRDRVESMVEWCRRGPPGAHVTGLDETPEEPRGAAGFRIEFAQLPGG